jgi:hypothetical protein
VKPGGAGGAYASIQDAIDAAGPGATINVYPGNYDETASGRFVLAGTPAESGPYQFGLFIGAGASGITIRGVDSRGRPVTESDHVQAFITTNATNDFGHSGTFVEGDHVTLSGLDFGVNAGWSEKTIEVTGDDFRMLDCVISDPQCGVYLGDWRFDVDADTSHMPSYRFEGNDFENSASLDIANGAGYSGPVSGRAIKHNTFTNADYWPSISFNGSDTNVPWFVYSVGGADIRDNSFVNTFTDDGIPLHMEAQGHIRARGTYDNSEFDWNSWWGHNKFDHAYVVGPTPPKVLRTYSYAPGVDYGWGLIHYDNVRRIGALLEGEEAHQELGDRILHRHN